MPSTSISALILGRLTEFPPHQISYSGNLLSRSGDGAISLTSAHVDALLESYLARVGSSVQ